MAALTAHANRKIKGAKTYAFQIANGVQIYAGGFVALAAGYARPFTGAAGQTLLGRAHPTPRHDLGTALLGDTAATPIPEAAVELEAEVHEKVAVTGVAAITDLGSVVFLNDTDNDLTLTRPARGKPFGVVVRWYSGTTCDVLKFGLLEHLADAGRTELLYLGHYDADSVANGDLRTGLLMPFRGKILSVFAMVDKAITGGGGTSALNLEIAGTNVTGGVVTVSTAAGGTKGAALAGTAVTGANTFSEGAALDVEAASTTDMTGGSFDLYAKVERLASI